MGKVRVINDNCVFKVPAFTSLLSAQHCLSRVLVNKGAKPEVRDSSICKTSFRDD